MPNQLSLARDTARVGKSLTKRSGYNSPKLKTGMKEGEKGRDTQMQQREGDGGAVGSAEVTGQGVLVYFVTSSHLKMVHIHIFTGFR